MADRADTCRTSRSIRGRKLTRDQEDKLPCNERPELAELEMYENGFLGRTAFAAASKSNTVTQCAIWGGPSAVGDDDGTGGGDGDGDGGKTEVVTGLLDDDVVVSDARAAGSISPR